MKAIAFKYLFLVCLLIYSSRELKAQTEYDIQIFIDNVSTEKPEKEELNFYLSAGEKCLCQGRINEAVIFFDFASSLGSQEGFNKLAALVGDVYSKNVYEHLAKGSSKGARTLIMALSKADSDLESALCVHDNLETYRLKSLRDPLIAWMPKTASDTTFLRLNDGVAYMIGKIKEESGKRFEALLLYELAAWEGNYEALEKTLVIGSLDETRFKEALVGRIKHDKHSREYLYLHKYFANEKLLPHEYSAIAHLMVDPNEKLVCRALGIYPFSYYEALQKREQLLSIILAKINSRGQYKKMSLEKVVRSIEERGYIDVINELAYCMGKKNEKDSLLLYDLIDAEKKLQKKEIEISREQIWLLKSFIIWGPQKKYSPQALTFIKNYLKDHSYPWAESVLVIIKDLPLDEKAIYSKKMNPYYPLYERGLFSKVHNTKIPHPNIIDIGL